MPIKIDCISDLHGHRPKLEGGDLLIIAGDVTENSSEQAYLRFNRWLSQQKYEKKVFIAGNHDNIFTEYGYPSTDKTEYLCDSGTKFEGLKIWGSPWTKWFYAVNPKCTAFMLPSDEELAKKWALIPEDTDILITHSPCYGIRDRAYRNNEFGFECVGSKSLQSRALNLDLKLWIVGHVHESYGIEPSGGFIGGVNCKHVNASLMDRCYEPVNKPIRIEL